MVHLVCTVLNDKVCVHKMQIINVLGIFYINIVF